MGDKRKSGSKQSKWIIPGAILVAAIIGWFFYDSYKNGDFSEQVETSMEKSLDD